ncbi:MAG: putative glycosyltransferase EpsH [Candidatus Hydrogenedentes bacterium ADurb.Bin179]|nr:MAG: putative glycosyltransferase EpsH [Candidatus Hydrogenedentes bacterium ADurb.Bin179]
MCRVYKCEHATPMNSSIIIPVYNRVSDLLSILKQLKEQACREFEVVVVDDGSTTPVTSAVQCAHYPYSLRIVRHEHRRGIAAARNTGIVTAREQHLIFVDSDADLLDSHWLEKHHNAYERAGAMARSAGHSHFVFHSTVKGIAATFAGRVDTYANWWGSDLKTAHIVRDRHVPMNNTSMHRDVFDRVGMFDEAFAVSEDIEWGFRCMACGVIAVFMPGAPVGHHDRDSVRKVWEHYYRFGQYSPKVRTRHPGGPWRWLYPGNRRQAILRFLPLTVLKTVYIVWKCFPQSPGVVLYAPGIYLANVASFMGMYKTLAAGPDEKGLSSKSGS